MGLSRGLHLCYTDIYATVRRLDWRVPSEGTSEVNKTFWRERTITASRQEGGDEGIQNISQNRITRSFLGIRKGAEMMGEEPRFLL